MEDRSLNGLISRIPINIFINPKITLDGIVSVVEIDGQIKEDLEIDQVEKPKFLK